VRTRNGADEYLIVAARKNPGHWIFPKGHVDPGETLAQAAERELLEESGTRGELVCELGSSAFTSGTEDVEVTWFLVRESSSDPSIADRAVRWLPFDEAHAQLTFDDSRRLLAAARDATARRS
jgi:diadenosine hexaphosphate hydrolase (ATP-forming)